MAGASTSDENAALSLIRKELSAIRKKLNKIEELVSNGKSVSIKEEEVLRSKSITLDCIKELEIITMEGINGSVVEMPLSNHQQPNHPVPKSKKASLRTNKNMNKGRMKLVEKGRYLCITDGIVIWCLDLNPSIDHESKVVPRPLTKISSINLLDMNLPVLISMFKVGSNVFMIGGQNFPSYKRNPNSFGRKLLNELYLNDVVQGSSCKTYLVSLLNGTLSVSESNNIAPLKKPKIWPIVEKINNQLHVFESLPSELGLYCPDTTPSHEFLDLTDMGRGWTLLNIEDEESKVDFHVSSHIVLNDHIYARAHRMSDQHIMFDTKTSKWRGNEHIYKRGKFYNTEINIDQGWGYRRFLAGRETEDDPYFVIAVGKTWYPVKKTCLEVYLVSSKTHESMRNQSFIHVFEGFMQPFTVLKGTLINVDKDGKTMCLVLRVNLDYGCREEFLYVVTFSMKEVDDFEAHIQERDRGMDFVKVVVKDKYVYSLDGDVGGDDDIGECVRLSACFM